MANPVVHFEVLGKDAAALRKFYSELFGWKIDADNPMKYGYVAAEAGGIRGGIASNQSETSLQTFYVEVDDLQGTLNKATKLGGQTVMPATEIPAANVSIAMVG